MKNENEIWKFIKGTNKKYKISNWGNLFSTGKNITMKLGGRYLATTILVDGKRKTVKAHRLVATHFIANPFNKPQVNHKDCDKQNNHVSNLEWVTSKENMQHAGANGKLSNGGGYYKLTAKQVIKIRKIFKNKLVDKSTIAKKYSVGYQTIHYIVNNMSWKHLC